MKELQSIFGERIAAYIRLRRSLGFKFERQAAVLRAFDSYVDKLRYRGMLTQELAVAFAIANPRISATECWHHYQFIRHFAEYLATFEPNTPRLNPRALRKPTQRPIPYVYTDAELTRLLEATRTVSSRRPIVGITLHSMIGLAASTGLRLSEIVGLDKVDVDLDRGLMTIRQSKFKKDRLVPLHLTTVAVLRQYVAARDAAYARHTSPAFFISLWRKRFSKNTVTCAFTELARSIGLRAPTGRGPSFHGLRHRFAVHRLVAWYEEGKNVQAMLPALATYLGHVKYTDTAYYITATSELMGLAAARYHGSSPEGPIEP